MNSIGKRIAPGFASDRRLDPAFDADACLADRRIEITLSEQRGNPIAETFLKSSSRSASSDVALERPVLDTRKPSRAILGCKRRRIIPVPVGRPPPPTPHTYPLSCSSIRSLCQIAHAGIPFGVGSFGFEPFPARAKPIGQVPAEIGIQQVQRRLRPIGRIVRISAEQRMTQKLLAELPIEQPVLDLIPVAPQAPIAGCIA